MSELALVAILGITFASIVVPISTIALLKTTPNGRFQSK